MPELPEVQTTVEGLQSLQNKKINYIKIHTNKLRYIIPKKLSKIITKQTIIRIYRKGKYIIINLNNNYSVILHLGMSGRLKICKKNKYKFEKHDHILLFVTSKILSFNDPRKFGFIDLVLTSQICYKQYFIKLGIDPFDKKLNYRYLYSKISRSSVAIKQILLNQSIISGIGNIYASEILFDAKISPLILGSELDIEEIKTLIKSIRKILKKAINHRGTSIRNYATIDGKLGNFQNNFRVYNKENEFIKGSRIIKIVQYGRSTFYCPDLQ